MICGVAALILMWCTVLGWWAIELELISLIIFVRVEKHFCECV